MGGRGEDHTGVGNIPVLKGQEQVDFVGGNSAERPSSCVNRSFRLPSTFRRWRTRTVRNSAVPGALAPNCSRRVVKHPARGGVTGHFSGESPSLLPQGGALAKSLVRVSWGEAQSSETIPLASSSKQSLGGLP